VQRSLRESFFTGTGISTFVGLILLGVGLISSTRWQISLLVGLTAALIGVLVTAFFAFAQRLDEIDERQITVRALQDLYKAPFLEAPLARIVGAVASTQGKRSAFLTEQTTAAVEEFSRQVADMAEGKFLCSSRDQELDLVKAALALTDEAVRAVASRGLEWWLRPEADVYFRAFAEEAARLQVTRIFMIDRDDLERARPVLEQHAAAGIATLAIDRELVPAGRRRGLVLFDDVLLHRAAPRREGGTDPEDVEFTDVGMEIKRARDDFDFLLKLATAHQGEGPACLFSGGPISSSAR
jgi:hypothetical protein